MRVHFRTMLVLALVMVAALGAALARQGNVQASDGDGDFIIRCFFNGNAVPEDPILSPRKANTANLNVFFGNMAAGSAAGNGTMFPNMQSGDYSGPSGTMEQNQLSLSTNCQDNKDTAGYWAPEPFTVNPLGVATPQLPGGSQGCTTNNCSPSVYLHQRVYYIPNGTAPYLEIRDGTIMVTGYPNGCQTVSGLPTPDGCTGNPPTTSYPQDTQVVEYACGADQGKGFATPISEWPYDCTHYVGRDSDDSYSDGAVAIVRFPYCWDGNMTGNFPAPNSPAMNGLPTHMVPGYVAPWIPYTAWQNYSNMTARPANDFAYPNSNGICADPNYPKTVVQLEERIHLLTYGAGWGPPSSCVGDGGINWNSSANKENSNNANDTTPGGDGEVPSDATFQLSPNLYGPWQCQSASAPNAKANTATLSFACSHGGDPSCTIPLSSPTGCGAARGTCYVGSYSLGWETLYAEYWQTWQEAQSTLDNPGDATADLGTFGDLVEDCTSGTSGKCMPSFIVTKNNSPSQVYGSGNP